MHSNVKTEIAKIFTSKEEAESFLSWLEAQRPQHQNIGLVGEGTAILKKGNGEILVRHIPNLIVNGGKDFIANSIGNRSVAGSTAAMGWIAVGTGTTAVAATQTALVTELARAAATYTHTAGTNTFQFETTYAAGTATGAITEAGVFNAASAGTMLDRVLFSVINKGADDSLTQRFTFTMS